jgi:putative Holliday junction resolvase
MGLDYGAKFIGIAMSDEAGLIASPLDRLRRVGLDKDIERIIELAKSEGVGEILVGMPLSMDGSEGPQAKKVAEFIHVLQERSGIQVVPWDERLTTVAAQRSLLEGNVSRARRRQVVDKVAAALMLQGYLDYRGLKRAANP